MICDLTGESKHAHRLVKKPIKFRGTSYPEFNKTLQAFVNRTNTFPDYFDVYKCLEHCNQQYGFGLKNDEIRRIAQDAFLKIGKLLQNRRKTDLYETATHFTGCLNDPAESDSALNAKLQENKKYRAKITSIIDRFAKEQDVAASENDKNKSTSSTENISNDENSFPNEKKDNDEEEIQEKDDGKEDVSIILDKETSKKTRLENGFSEETIENENSETEKETIKKNKNPRSVLKNNHTVNASSSAVSMEEIVISDEDDS